MRRLRGFLFWLARFPLAGRVLRLGFAYMSFLIPVQRLRETPHLLAFYHPSPSYPVHILLVPKRECRSLLDLAPDDGFLPDLLSTVQSLVRELGLERTGYRLIANGGSYQDIPILHFHLVAEK